MLGYRSYCSRLGSYLVCAPWFTEEVFRRGTVVKGVFQWRNLTGLCPVVPTGSGRTKKVAAEKASSVHATQREAEQAAREMLRNSGGGELTTAGRDGKIRSKDTIAPGNDPNPPKDREH